MVRHDSVVFLGTARSVASVYGCFLMTLLLFLQVWQEVLQVGMAVS